MASECRAASTASHRGVIFQHLARRSPLAAVAALSALLVIVARLVLLYAASNSTSNAAARKSQLLRFPQARPPAFSARLHFHHGPVQHLFPQRPHAHQDQLLWEPRTPIATIELPPAGVVSFRRRDGSSGRLTAANASSFCLADPHACTDWFRVRFDLSLEAALHHLRESGAFHPAPVPVRLFWLTATSFVEQTPPRKPLSAYRHSMIRTPETIPSPS